VNFILFRSELGMDICVHMADFDSDPMVDFNLDQNCMIFLVLEFFFFGSFSIQILEFFDQWV